MSRTTVTKILSRQRTGLLRDVLWAAALAATYAFTASQLPL